MYFKVAKGSTLFFLMNLVKIRIDHCKEQAQNLAVELGGDSYMVSSNRYLAGGIAGIKFNEKPEGWKLVYGSLIFYPKSNRQNRELLERINALPVVTPEELNEVVGFKPQTIILTSGTLCFIKCVGIYWGEQFHLIWVQRGCQYEPVEGIEEITGSEFDRLKKTLPDFQEIEA